jgi:hypothetical protein
MMACVQTVTVFLAEPEATIPAQPALNLVSTGKAAKTVFV